MTTENPTTKAKRGRKPGQLSTKPTQSELYAAMGELAVNDYVYLEGDYKEVMAYQRRATVEDGRKPTEVRGKKFSTSIYTAVCARMATDVRYLIRIAREA